MRDTYKYINTHRYTWRHLNRQMANLHTQSFTLALKQSTLQAAHTGQMRQRGNHF
jgi:hypothetical protein